MQRRTRREILDFYSLSPAEGHPRMEEKKEEKEKKKYAES